MATITFGEMKRRVQAFKVMDEAADILSENTDAIVALDKEQMFHGLHGQGGQIGRYKDPEYAADKYEQNPAAGFGQVDLRLTGSFYDKMYARMNGSTLEISSTDSKTDKLAKKYGNAIFKLNVPSKNVLRKDILQPNLVHRFAEKTGAQLG